MLWKNFSAKGQNFLFRRQQVAKENMHEHVTVEVIIVSNNRPADITQSVNKSM